MTSGAPARRGRRGAGAPAAPRVLYDAAECDHCREDATGPAGRPAMLRHADVRVRLCRECAEDRQVLFGYRLPPFRPRRLADEVHVSW